MTETSAICPLCGNYIFIKKKYNSRHKKNQLLLSNIFVCNNCDFGFSSPLPSAAIINSYYSEGHYWDKEGGLASTNTAHSKNQAYWRAKWCKENIGSDITSALDIGAGHGWQGDALKKYFPHIRSYAFIEPDMEATKIILLRLGKQFCTKINELSNGEKFDIIFLSQVLEHNNDANHFLNEVKKNIIQGGSLYIEVPNRDDIFKKDVFPHIFFFSKNSLKIQLEKVGFKIIAIEEFGNKPKKSFYRFFASALFRIGIILHSPFMINIGDTLIWGYQKNNNGLWIRALVKNE